MTAELSDRAVRLYELEEAAKFLATVSADGIPNVTLIVSQVPVEPDRVVFGEFMMVKTKKNLDENPRVASLTVTPKLELAGFKGDVIEWVRSGPYVDRINSIDFFRYNAYMGIHNVAVVSIRETLPLAPRVPYTVLLRDFIALLAVGGVDGSSGTAGVDTPGVVRSKFNSLMSVKVLAFLGDDGYPNIAPVLSTRFTSKGLLSFKLSGYNKVLKGLTLPSRVALNVVTMEPKTYQVKGELVKLGKRLGAGTGVVRVDEVYTCIPPFLGDRIA